MTKPTTQPEELKVSLVLRLPAAKAEAIVGFLVALFRALELQVELPMGEP